MERQIFFLFFGGLLPKMKKGMLTAPVRVDKKECDLYQAGLLCIVLNVELKTTIMLFDALVAEK